MQSDVEETKKDKEQNTEHTNNVDIGVCLELVIKTTTNASCLLS